MSDISTSLTMILNMLYFVLFSVPLPVVLTIGGTLIFTVIIYLKTLVRGVEDMPRLVYRDSSLAKHILAHCPRIRAAYRPPRWATNSHIQTIVPRFLPSCEFQFERQFLQMKDRGIVALDWGVTGAGRLHRNSPVLIALPNLTSDASSLGFLCKLAIRRGFRPVVFNRRGNAGSPLTTPRLQSFGDPTDLRQAVRYIRSTFPNSKIVGFGSGLGSGLLISYLGEYGSSSYMTAAVCVSPCYDAESLLRKPLAFPYNLALLYGVKYNLALHSPALSKSVDVGAAMKTHTLTEFERTVHCKSYGFKSMTDYWDRNNPNRDIDDVCTPVLCIHSKDDPVCPEDSIDYDLFSVSPNMMLITTQYGGHGSFLEARNLEPWSDKISIEYLSAVNDFIEKHPS